MLDDYYNNDMFANMRPVGEKKTSQTFSSNMFSQLKKQSSRQ